MRKFVILGATLLICVVLPCTFGQAGEDVALKAGFARVEITCPVGIPLIGSWGKPSESVLDPLYARAMVLGDGHSTIAIVSADLLYAPHDEIVGPVRSLIRERCEIAEENVLICATHTHSGPEVFTRSKIPADGRLDPSLIDQTYLHALRERIADAVCTAHGDMRAAAVGFARGYLPEVVFNRRPIGTDAKAKMTLSVSAEIAAGRTIRIDGEGNTRVAFARLGESGLRFGPVDADVCVLRVEDAAGKMMGSMINFGCHPVCVYPYAATAISADFPGDACAVIEGVEGGTCLFALAPAGNLVPYQRGLAEHQQIGRAIAGEAIKRLQFVPTESSVSLAAEIKRIHLPLKKQKVDEGAECIETEMQVLRIGEIYLLGLPGEILVEIGLEIKKKAGIEKLVVISLSNDAIGYVCHAAAYEEGGYEPGSGTELAKGSGEVMIAEALDLLRRMKAR